MLLCWCIVDAKLFIVIADRNNLVAYYSEISPHVSSCISNTS